MTTFSLTVYLLVLERRILRSLLRSVWDFTGRRKILNQLRRGSRSCQASTGSFFKNSPLPKGSNIQWWFLCPRKWSRSETLRHLEVSANDSKCHRPQLADSFPMSTNQDSVECIGTKRQNNWLRRRARKGTELITCSP